MAYYEEKVVLPCPKCKANNHIIAAYAGDSRANEREPVFCYKCKELVTTIECWSVWSASTPEAAEKMLRLVQNRT
jgi:serine protease inhibitor ecotin